jgi:hypothetical protein
MVFFKIFDKMMIPSLYLLKKNKALFVELVVASQPISLEDFNLYMFHGVRGEFKDLAISLVTKAEPFSYTNLYSHLLTHKFLQKTSLQSIGAVDTTPLFPTSLQPPSAHVA